MTIFNVTGGGSGGDGSPTFKEMTTALYEIKASDWGNHYTAIPNNFFISDSLMEKMEIPEGFTSIGNSGFNGCSALTEIVLPQSIITIGSNAFYNCTALTEIVLPQNITTINMNTFYNCTSLINIVIPQNVTSISASALSRIGYDTNDGCTVTMLRSTPPSILNTTFNQAKIKKIIVPQGSLTAYQTATNWSALAQYMEEAP